MRAPAKAYARRGKPAARKDSNVLVALIGGAAIIVNGIIVSVVAFAGQQLDAPEHEPCAVVVQTWEEIGGGNPDRIDILAETIGADERTRECELDAEKLKDLATQ